MPLLFESSPNFRFNGGRSVGDAFFFSFFASNEKNADIGEAVNRRRWKKKTRRLFCFPLIFLFHVASTYRGFSEFIYYFFLKKWVMNATAGVSNSDARRMEGGVFKKTKSKFQQVARFVLFHRFESSCFFLGFRDRKRRQRRSTGGAASMKIDH